MSVSDRIRTAILRPPPVRRLAGALLRAVIPEYVRIDGVRIAMNQRDAVVCGALTVRQYERAEIAFVRASIRPGMRIVDVGANVGLYTALFASKCGSDGVVAAFEPDPQSFQFLRKTTEANGFRNCRLVNAAASSAKGRMELYTSSGNRGDNRLYRNASADGCVPVDVVTLDEELPALGISSIDFLKIDVQGFEAHVFDGARQTLERSRGVIILTEFWPDGLSKAGSDPHALFQSFRSLGFSVYRLGPRRVLTRVTDERAFIDEHPGWKYANLVLLGPDAVCPGVV